eukprot:5341920-Amphidinium_carterae.1
MRNVTPGCRRERLGIKRELPGFRSQEKPGLNGWYASADGYSQDVICLLRMTILSMAWSSTQPSITTERNG